MQSEDQIEDPRTMQMWADDRASQALGITMNQSEPGRTVVSMTIRPDMVNGLGVCHGGIIFTLADSAMALASNAQGATAFASSADMTWLRSAQAGDELVATASERATVGRTGVYDVVVVNQNTETVALFQGRVRHVARTPE